MQRLRQKDGPVIECAARLTEPRGNTVAVRYVETCRLPTPFGVFDMHGFEEPDTGKEHIALTLGDLDNQEPMLARTHSECLTGDALYSMRCDCGYQLE